MKQNKRPNPQFQSGTLVVTGHDKVEISLHDVPRHVEVHFKKLPEPAPCDHSPHEHRHNRLKWSVHKSHRHHSHTYHLVIKWDVTCVREIVWLVNY